MTETYGTRLASLDPETAERPDSRIGNAGNARQLVNRLKAEDDTRMYRYTRMMGLMDGNPPWNSQKLIDIGQGHRANFNLRESEAIVEAAKTPYYDLVFEVPYFAEIFFHMPGVESHISDKWSDIATEEYTDTLAGWDGFDHQMQLHQWQMIVNGVGPIFWPHYIGWYSEAIKSRKVLVPMETKANVDELEMAAVLHSYRADELERFISKGGTYEIDGDGWNIPLCERAIIDSAQREMRQSWGTENYDLYQRAIRTGDLFHGIHRSDRIYVASVFVKEFGGKVSHYMITDQNLGHTSDTFEDNLGREVGYLFKRRRKFDGFSQVICPFFYDSGPDGTWHAIKGLGPKIYDFCDVSNRTFCQMLDGSVIGSGVILEAQDANAIEETQISLVGGAAVVSPGYKVVQTRIAESLDGAMAMRRELHGTLQANTGSYRQRTEEAKPEPTLGQANIVNQQQTILTKGATNRYYNNLDKWHRENVRRLLDPMQSKSIPGGEEALNFKARCILRGIPEEVMDFKFVKRVIATRSIGYGSPALRDNATRELVGMIPYMDEVSRNHALRARAAALPGVGMYSVDSFFPPIEKTGVPNAHAALAVLENNALRAQGGRALVEPQQNHSIHFDTHMQDVMQHAQDPQAQPVEKLIHMEQAGPHMTQHLQALQGDPTRKNEVRAKQKQLDEIGHLSDKLHQELTESMKAAASQNGQNGEQQQPTDPEMVPKVMKAAGDLKLKAENQRAKHALKAEDQQFKHSMKDKETAANLKREAIRTAAELQRAEVRTQAEISTGAQRTAAETAKTRQGMNIESAKTKHSIAVDNAKARADIKAKAAKAAEKPKPSKES